ncbi:extracellular solute-binding protein [Butyrivibrio sp. VCB2006]|uniref:extracellular solute-binding protein n=1 Tax=Butyrivibrio sp. VCB2006 TaxID=1280679 RepID=UPI00040BC28E|nr:extracellular solute-binding protein [Butyrivibrio sp. VCB2006]
MRKKLFSITLCVLLTLSLLACGNNSPTSSVYNYGTTLNIAARDGSHSDVISAVKAAFESQYNCNVNIISLSADEIHDTVIKDAENENGIYDVIMIDDPLMPEYIEKNVLTNLTHLGYSDDDDFVEKSRLLGKDPYPLGATYALPFSGNVQLIFYNSDVVGTDPDLSNWQSILETCQKLNSNGQKGYAIRGQAGNPIVSDFLPILWAFGGDLFDNYNNVILDSKESLEALNFYIKLLETGDNYDKDGLIDAVSGGQAAIALGWPSWFISGTGTKAQIAQIPGKKASSSDTLPTGEIGNWLLGVTANSNHQELALELVKYLTSASVQKEALSYGGVPTRKSIFRDKTVQTEYPFFQAIYSGTNNSRVRPRTTKWSQIEDAFGKELEKCIKGEETAEECLKNSQEAIKALAE